MGASDRPADLSLDDGPSKKSIFSFLSNPLRARARNRNLAEFYVKVDEPHRQYSCGEHITGSVVLTVVKPIRITHLTVCLHGFVRVFKSGAQLNAVNPAVVTSDGTRSFRYYGNGHAQLFQDEQILCGEGRLTARKWEFKYDLVFPPKGLPSSIDFERGTISYMITATLTRPTSIAAIATAETKVCLVEKVDIGLLVPPRERSVTMQAMRRRARKKKAPVASVATTQINAAATETADTALDLDLTRRNENFAESSVNLEEPTGQDSTFYMPRSPIHSDLQSEVSADSAATHNSSSGRGVEASNGSVAGSRVSGGVTEDREITATVELLKGGCLPGDLLPIKISVNHNRRMKSMHGIIVTLYRQGRVDYAPPMSLFTNLSKEDAERLEREEYYPKSRTGLGGLSLSSAGSCSVFRKDLSQVITPLIIDPKTLSANITTSVRVPEDVFPSIKSVPGGLICFRYHVEVVVDLGGRLAGQTQASLQQPGNFGSVPGQGVGSSSALSPHDASRLANWSGTIIDTDNIRREKGVISVSFEVVVGTTDSNRSRGKSVVRPPPTSNPTAEREFPDMEDLNYSWQESFEEGGAYDINGGDVVTPYEQSQSYYPADRVPHGPYYDFYPQESPAPIYIPPPQLVNQNGLSEKERVRQAEQRLLPSRPPTQPSVGSEAGPSQPPALARLSPRPDAPIIQSSTDNDVIEGPSAPTLAQLSETAVSNTLDDKQELERRRLIAEASAPPEVPEDFEAEGPSAPPRDLMGPSTSHEPTAPMLNEHGIYGSRDPYESFAGPSTTRRPHEHGHGVEPLPEYKR